MSRYIRLDVDSVYTEPGWNLSVVVKLDDEGVVVDLVESGNEVLQSAWKLYPDFGVTKIEFEDKDYQCISCGEWKYDNLFPTREQIKLGANPETCNQCKEVKDV